MTTIVSIDGAGRIVVPKPFRDMLNLRPGSQLELTSGFDHLQLRPVDDRPGLVCEDGIWIHQAHAEAPLGGAVQSSREERMNRLSRGIGRAS